MAANTVCYYWVTGLNVGSLHSLGLGCRRGSGWTLSIRYRLASGGLLRYRSPTSGTATMTRCDWTSLVAQKVPTASGVLYFGEKAGGPYGIPAWPAAWPSPGLGPMPCSPAESGCRTLVLLRVAPQYRWYLPDGCRGLRQPLNPALPSPRLQLSEAGEGGLGGSIGHNYIGYIGEIRVCSGPDSQLTTKKQGYPAWPPADIHRIHWNVL